MGKQWTTLGKGRDLVSPTWGMGNWGVSMPILGDGGTTPRCWRFRNDGRGSSWRTSQDTPVLGNALLGTCETEFGRQDVLQILWNYEAICRSMANAEDNERWSVC